MEMILERAVRWLGLICAGTTTPADPSLEALTSRILVDIRGVTVAKTRCL